MKKIMTAAVLAGAALGLAACNGETTEPAAEDVAEETGTAEGDVVTDETMTDEDAAALEAAAAAAEGTETNSNPIGPAASSADGAAE
ncbi:MAG: hypothetical protein CVT85_04875 [Alphaproteobacteria bacterium HGW-Alphaproteobacteria-7]|jgi:predicted small secreted protein|nr:MAG: hypothetical protein CVT85_04875 [Alphaproteobacteria bacterium HGW-Alphaproteobacteria-7]